MPDPLRPLDDWKRRHNLPADPNARRDPPARPRPPGGPAATGPATDPLPTDAVTIAAKALCCGREGCDAERDGGTCCADIDELSYRKDALKVVIRGGA